MAKDGDQDDAKGEKPDPERDYNEGKLRMRTDKTLMTKKLKRLENAIADFVELQQMDIPKEDLVGAAKEVVECRDATKEAYNKIKATNEVLVKKLVEQNRVGKVPDVEEAMKELTNAVETYWEKWESVRMGNKKTLMEADRTVNTTSVLVVSSGSVAVSSDFIRFNPAPDARPGFLERDSSMLDVLNWIEQATYYVKTGFKNQPPPVGSHIHLAPLINQPWLQSK